MGVPEIESFLTHLAVEGNVTASTQNQALALARAAMIELLFCQSVVEPLQIHLQQLRLIHQHDLSLGYGVTILPWNVKIPMLPINGLGNCHYLVKPCSRA
jgi:hypothetical protein